MDSDTKTGIIVVSGIVLVVALIAGGLVASHAMDRRALTACIQTTRDPVNCRLALEQR